MNTKSAPSLALVCLLLCSVSASAVMVNGDSNNSNITAEEERVHPLSPGEECPPGSYARNCGGCPCMCECYNSTLDKVVEHRECKLDDDLVNDTILLKDYSGNDFFSVYSCTLDCDGHTLTGNGTIFAHSGATIKNCVLKGNRSEVGIDCSYNCTVIGNTIINKSTGIKLYYGSNYNNISNNNVSNNDGSGIYLYQSGGNNISNNLVSNNEQDGIRLRFNSDRNELINNTVKSNGESGISLNRADNNTVTCNDANLNWNGHGIYLYLSSHNNLTDNNVSSNNCGIYLDSSKNNSLTDNVASGTFAVGIYMSDNSSNNTLTSNIVSRNGGGIYASHSNNNTLISNNVSSNGDGIVICYLRVDLDIN